MALAFSIPLLALVLCWCPASSSFRLLSAFSLALRVSFAFFVSRGPCGCSATGRKVLASSSSSSLSSLSSLSGALFPSFPLVPTSPTSSGVWGYPPVSVVLLSWFRSSPLDSGTAELSLCCCSSRFVGTGRSSSSSSADAPPVAGRADLSCRSLPSNTTAAAMTTSSRPASYILYSVSELV